MQSCMYKVSHPFTISLIAIKALGMESAMILMNVWLAVYLVMTSVQADIGWPNVKPITYAEWHGTDGF
jgi:hypothetical protein